jgi:hypothetical protein
MKQLYWAKISNSKFATTVWRRVDDTRVALDRAALEQMFGAKIVVAKASAAADGDRPKGQNVALLDPQRAQSIGIKLSHFRRPIPCAVQRVATQRNMPKHEALALAALRTQSLSGAWMVYAGSPWMYTEGEVAGAEGEREIGEGYGWTDGDLMQGDQSGDPLTRGAAVVGACAAAALVVATALGRGHQGAAPLPSDRSRVRNAARVRARRARDPST